MIIGLWALTFLLIAGCLESPAPDLSVTDHAQKYHLIEDDAFRGDVDRAVAVVNYILDDNVGFKLVPNWKARPSGERSIPIYLVNIEPKGKYGISFVPRDDGCVFIDAGLIPEINDLFSNGFKGRSEIETHVLLAIVLLHESGHLFQRKTGSYADSSTGETYNVLTTKTKEVEMEADSFAARLIREGKNPLSESNRFHAATTLSMALSKVSFNLTGYRVLMRSGDSVLGSPALFGDSGYSHPNLILRVLTMNYELLPIPEAKALLDEFLEKRRSASDVLVGS